MRNWRKLLSIAIVVGGILYAYLFTAVPTVAPVPEVNRPLNLPPDAAFGTAGREVQETNSDGIQPTAVQLSPRALEVLGTLTRSKEAIDDFGMLWSEVTTFEAAVQREIVSAVVRDNPVLARQTAKALVTTLEGNAETEEERLLAGESTLLRILSDSEASTLSTAAAIEMLVIARFKSPEGLKVAQQRVLEIQDPSERNFLMKLIEPLRLKVDFEENPRMTSIFMHLHRLSRAVQNPRAQRLIERYQTEPWAYSVPPLDPIANELARDLTDVAAFNGFQDLYEELVRLTGNGDQPAELRAAILFLKRLPFPDSAVQENLFRQQVSNASQMLATKGDWDTSYAWLTFVRENTEKLTQVELNQFCQKTVQFMEPILSDQLAGVSKNGKIKFLCKTLIELSAGLTTEDLQDRVQHVAKLLISTKDYYCSWELSSLYFAMGDRLPDDLLFPIENEIVGKLLATHGYQLAFSLSSALHPNRQFHSEGNLEQIGIRLLEVLNANTETIGQFDRQELIFAICHLAPEMSLESNIRAADQLLQNHPQRLALSERWASAFLQVCEKFDREKRSVYLKLFRERFDVKTLSDSEAKIAETVDSGLSFARDGVRHRDP